MGKRFFSTQSPRSRVTEDYRTYHKLLQIPGTCLIASASSVFLNQGVILHAGEDIWDPSFQHCL